MENRNASHKVNKKFYFTDFLWDCWCLISLIGIWPRFFEPNILTTKKLNLKIPRLPASLKKFTILQFSDLHLQTGMPEFFFRKLIRKINEASPDLIVFTGDFLCYSKFGDRERLKKLFSSLSAPYGCYAVLGNHDYQQTISINSKGEYDIIEKRSSLISTGLSRIFSTIKLAKSVTERAKAVPLNTELVKLIQDTPFRLLNNCCVKIPVKETFLNLCGLGEYTLGKCLPDKAFKNYDKNYPGIVLSHNPDTIPLLQNYPGDLILCGHTHGGQINLPWLWKKFTLLENMQYKYGLFRLKDKWAYVSRGVGSVMQFRWFAIPEIVLFTLE